MYHADHQDTSLVITMAAELSRIDAVCEDVDSFLEAQRLATCRFGVLLGLREALGNAVLHGCGQDPAKRVRIRLVLENANLACEVEDDGEGFPWKEIVTRGLPTPEATGGRGLQILQRYFDKVTFNAAGNSVRFVKRCAQGEVMEQIERSGARVVVRPEHDIVASVVNDMQHELQRLVDDGVRTVVIDMTRVDMLDSIGIGLLIATHNSLQAVGGALVLEHVNPDIRKLLSVMRLDQHLEVPPPPE